MSSNGETAHPTSKRSRKVTRTPSETQSRQQSEAGGVPLPRNAEPAAGRRRRPRKLNASVNEGGKEGAVEPAISAEVEALKCKVLEIEAQLQEILLRPNPINGPTKSARRRARKEKAQAVADEPKPKQHSEQEDEAADQANELKDLQHELEKAHEELSSLKEQKDTDVEEIPRLETPALETQRPRPLGRSVTLAGSYRLPIPVEVSTADLDAIGRGIRTAQSIARSYLDSHPTATVSDRSTEEQGSGSWSQWFGGYSMSLAKAIDKVQIGSTMTIEPVRPTVQQRSETAPPTRRKPAKLERRGRPEQSRRLSEQQVAGLLA